MTERDIRQHGPDPSAPTGPTSTSSSTRPSTEQRFASEIWRRFGVMVESPVDPFSRPQRRGDFGLRIPPSAAALREFFKRWRQNLAAALKYLVACRDYVMTKIAYISGVRAAELCGVLLSDVHWEAGQWGRFTVNGKGARGSGPR
ncbi:hypothetical protein [Streptomyces virginiae]|uniref:hypothetical protein n=1 Tax=Streptomyces virginiae TaxID=1961 RepID=UPI0036ADA590